VKTLLLALVRFYQRVVSPVLPTACRFTPTCSQFAAEAIRRHGALRGSRLALGRVLRCRPFATPGHDPVPDA
jgi:putative membrane protein insertion efficiency factor